MRLAYANIRHGLDDSAVKRCAKKAKRHADVIGFSEIRNGDEDALIEGLGSGFSIENFSCRNPIAFNKDKYRLTPPRRLPGGFQNRGVFQFHPGDSRVPTPERTCSWIILDHLNKPRIAPVAVFGGQFINKAWNGKEKDREIDKLREELWLESHEEFSWKINTFRRHGLTVVWMLDANKLFRRMPEFTPRQDLVVKHGIDQMYVAKGRAQKSAKYTIGKHRIINNPSDHHMIVGTVNFR